MGGTSDKKLRRKLKRLTLKVLQLLCKLAKLFLLLPLGGWVSTLGVLCILLTLSTSKECARKRADARRAASSSCQDSTLCQASALRKNSR